MGVKSGIQDLYSIISLQRGIVADIAHAAIRASSPTVHWYISQRNAYHDMPTRLAPGMQSCIPPRCPLVNDTSQSPVPNRASSIPTSHLSFPVIH